MKRLLTFAAALALSSPVVGRADEPKQKVERPSLLSERPKAEPAAPNPGAARAVIVGGGAQQPIASTGPWGNGRSAAGWYIEQTDKVAKLTPEQKQKIERLFEQRDQEMRAIQAAITAKSQALSQEMSRAVQLKDQELIAKVQKSYQELYAPMSEIAKKSSAALEAVLTAEQKAKVHDNRVASQIAAYAPGVTFSEAQLKQIKEGIGQAGNHEGFERKLPELLNKALTAEQAGEIARQRMASVVKYSFANAKLTPEQHKKIENRITELAKDHKEGLQIAPNIFSNLTEFVSSLLTPEQKEAQNGTRFAVGGFVGGWTENAKTTATQKNPGAKDTAPGASPTNPPAAKPAERKMPAGETGNLKVTQIPGGGIQVIIREGNEGTETKPNHEARERTEEVQRRLQDLMKQAHASHRDGMRERVRRQRELTKKASKIVKQLDQLDSQESPKARDLWKQLEQVQAELQHTFGGPQAFSFGTAPGQPAGAWVVQSGSGIVSSSAGGAGGIVVSSSGQPQGNPAPVRIETRPLTPQPNNIPPPATAEILKAIETLRKQVEELRTQVKKLSEK